MRALILNYSKKHIAAAQRIMDDIIDLELEKVDVILKKIKADPELEETKAVEYNLWTKHQGKSRTRKANRNRHYRRRRYAGRT